ncbi:hypothetical protein C8R45DRAFT_923314 [Mycena sanguinolenta]|nr:hypothetical protein C8R45DRAFT_923314 [Mycena sanguinolenta]
MLVKLDDGDVNAPKNLTTLQFETMRFFSAGVLAFFTAAVGSASAAATVNINRRCNLSECIIALAAEGVSCAAALAEAGVDPLADIACILDAGAASLAVSELCNVWEHSWVMWTLALEAKRTAPHFIRLPEQNINLLVVGPVATYENFWLSFVFTVFNGVLDLVCQGNYTEVVCLAVASELGSGVCHRPTSQSHISAPALNGSEIVKSKDGCGEGGQVGFRGYRDGIIEYYW